MKHLLPIFAAGLTIAGAANATVLTFTHTIPATTVPFTSVFTLSSFSTALGTLTGVEILLDDTTSATVDIYNLNATSSSFTDASASVPLTITGPAAVSLTDTVTAGPISGVAAPGLNTYTGASGNSTVTTSIAPADFSSYESATPQSLTFGAVAANGTYTGTAGFGVLFGGSATAGGTVEVEYTYTPVPTVPEPASWALMMIGFGAMGGVLRRRREVTSAPV
jgi:hypothetical protein